MKILMDSSMWIEFFTGGRKAKGCDKFFKLPYKIVLPSIVTYEVYKKIKTLKGEQVALLLLAQMERLSAIVVPIDEELAVQAADISLQYKIPMADAMIYSSAMISEATIITMDAHFKGLPKAQFVSQ